MDMEIQLRDKFFSLLEPHKHFKLIKVLRPQIELKNKIHVFFRFR